MRERAVVRRCEHVLLLLVALASTICSCYQKWRESLSCRIITSCCIILALVCFAFGIVLSWWLLVLRLRQPCHQYLLQVPDSGL